MSMHRLVLILLAAMVAAGCASRDTQPDDAGSVFDEEDTGAETQRAPGEGGFEEGELGTRPGEAGEMPARLLEETIIYFDFDSSSVRPSYSETLAAHAAYLAENSGMRVRLEGHTDERGSREYNIGLGERRSQAVRRALMLQGVGATQISTVSYGEERPGVTGSDEEAWEMNRRVEIVYLR